MLVFLTATVKYNEIFKKRGKSEVLDRGNTSVFYSEISSLGG